MCLFDLWTKKDKRILYLMRYGPEKDLYHLQWWSYILKLVWMNWVKIQLHGLSLRNNFLSPKISHLRDRNVKIFKYYIILYSELPCEISVKFVWSPQIKERIAKSDIQRQLLAYGTCLQLRLRQVPKNNKDTKISSTMNNRIKFQ